MPHEVIMPALGMAQDTGLLVAWRKAPGDAVAVGDVLFEVETDKATMEVEALADGFLTNVQAEAGQDVPVGQVIALLSETAQDSAPKAAPAAMPAAEPAPLADLPAGETVIMPTLGMAQDTGLLVAWRKAPGDAVVADDVLFEVETDKSTVEVNAGHDGYIAALLAEAGDDVPVGQTIAIISQAKPENPISRAAQAATSAVPSPAVTEAPKPPVAAPKPQKPIAQPAGGRILASPKARRLALEQGLDLARLVDAGHPQPFHAADIDLLRAMPVTAQQAAGPSARRLKAKVKGDGFAEFAAWAAAEAGIKDSDTLLAGLAAASLVQGVVTIGVQTFDRDRLFQSAGQLSETRIVTDETPDLVLRDLRFSPISALALGAEDQPIISLTKSGSGITITLECAADHLSGPQAIALISAFAGRIEQPLRHLL